MHGKMLLLERPKWRPAAPKVVVSQRAQCAHEPKQYAVCEARA